LIDEHRYPILRLCRQLCDPDPPDFSVCNVLILFSAANPAAAAAAEPATAADKQTAAPAAGRKTLHQKIALPTRRFC
jgi:hypothetical protein